MRRLSTLRQGTAPRSSSTAGSRKGRALEANPDWVHNDLAPWNYHALPAALGCRGWFTAKVTTLGELDAASIDMRCLLLVGSTGTTATPTGQVWTRRSVRP